MNPIDRCTTWVERSRDVHVLVEAPAGSRCKFRLDQATGTFRIARVLPLGLVFPYEFGSICGTLAEDGDPLDCMVLLEAPTFAGCVLEARLVGVIEAREREGSRSRRDDRLLAVARASQRDAGVRSLADLDPDRLDQIERFLERQKGEGFHAVARRGPTVARRLVELGHRRHRAARTGATDR
jgi:inorganic pyrophosphatase